jgi:outer membrane protein TolC
LIVLAIAACGCSPTRYRQSADRDAYRIIELTQREVFGQPDAGFTIEKQLLPEFIRAAQPGGEEKPGVPESVPPGENTNEENATLTREQAISRLKALFPKLSDETIQTLDNVDAAGLLRLLSAELTDERMGTLQDTELIALLKLSHEELAELIIPPPPNAVKLTLAQTLEVAVANSRDFQAQKESLFVRALGLSYQRHLWRPQLGLTGSTDWKKENDEESIGGDAKFSAGQLLASGAQLALNLGTNFAEFLTGDRRRAVGSLLSLTFTQPLLRGGGRLIARESLTQAERSMIYEVRDFARYRKEFSVQRVAQAYYDVLQERDTLINNFKNYLSLQRNSMRNEEMQKAGQVQMLDVLEARRAELSAKNNWILARQAYLDRLDGFKISPLGLPTETPLILDENELRTLTKKAEGGLLPPDITAEEAQDQALVSRLDLMNAEDALEDSERAVLLARDALRAGLDFSFSTSADTEPETKALKFRFHDSPYNVGLGFDLPIDRKQERNAYRQALISLESQKRSFSLLRDNIKLQVRQAYRNLEQARKSYEIQDMIVDQTEMRVDIAEMQREFGDATSYDVLRAKDDLLQAQIALTSALVSHEMARLQLWLSTESLQVDDKGLWVEQNPSERGDQNAEGTERAESEKEKLPKS